MIENVVIGQLMVPEHHFFAYDEMDWIQVEKAKTLFTEERNIAKILVALGIAPSISEVRRNKPGLLKPIDDETTDFLKIKWGKKFLFVAIGKK